MSSNEHVLLLSRKVSVHIFQTRLIDSLCYILVILGVIGNLFGLIIFSSSRRSWSISSSYVCLATCSSIANLLCVFRYVSVLYSTSRHHLHELIGEKWWACKIYEFSFSFRIISSWITLFWMFERLICVSKRLRSFFNRFNSFKLNLLIPITLAIAILGCVIGPPVYMFRPQMSDNELINATIYMNKTYCGLDPNASVNWQQYFHEIRFGKNHYTLRCLFSELIPAGTIILCNSYIISHLVRACRCLYRIKGDGPRKKQSQTTSWMNIVLILHSSLFVTSLISHLFGHFMNIEAHEAWWVSLAILVNYSLNFYVYCLSGKAFRNEIRRLIHRFKPQFYYKLQTRQNRPRQ